MAHTPYDGIVEQRGRSVFIYVKPENPSSVQNNRIQNVRSPRTNEVNEFRLVN